MNDKKALKAIYGANNHQILSTHKANNALLSQILQKAREFDSPLFSNVTFLHSLATLYENNETHLSSKNQNAIVEIVEWIIEVERSGQLS